MRIRRIVGDMNRKKIYFPKFVRKMHGGVPKNFEWAVQDTEDGHQTVYREVDLQEVYAGHFKPEQLDIYLDKHSIDRPVTKYVLPIYNMNYQNESYDFIQELIAELIDFPYAKHDDAPDAWSRIYDVDLENLVGNNSIQVIEPDFNY